MVNKNCPYCNNETLMTKEKKTMVLIIIPSFVCIFMYFEIIIYSCIYFLSVFEIILNVLSIHNFHIYLADTWQKNLFSKNTKYVMLLLQDKSWFLVLKSNHKNKKLQLLVNGFHANFLTVSHMPNIKPHSPLCCFIKREKASWKLKFERSKTWEGRKSGSQILL